MCVIKFNHRDYDTFDQVVSFSFRQGHMPFPYKSDVLWAPLTTLLFLYFLVMVKFGNISLRRI